MTGLAPAKRRKTKLEATLLIRRFLDRLAALKVLDPACGSGNFLYLALQGVKDLENASVYILKENLRNLRTQQCQRLSVATFLMSFCSLRLWVLMTY